MRLTREESHLLDLCQKAADTRAHMTEYIKEVDRRELWKRMGFHSLRDFIQTYLGCSATEARQILIGTGDILTQDQMQVDNQAVQKRIDRLLEWRRKRARKEQRPVYSILSNRSIMTIAGLAPQNLEELSRISGVGKTTLERFGRELLRTLQRS